MLNYLTLILTCQLAGEVITKSLEITAPGPVIGMALLFIILYIKGNIPKDLESTSDALINNLSLLFVPAGVGVMLHFQLLKDEWLPISVALIVSTVLTIVVTGLIMNWLSSDQLNELEDTPEQNSEGEI